MTPERALPELRKLMPDLERLFPSSDVRASSSSSSSNNRAQRAASGGGSSSSGSTHSRPEETTVNRGVIPKISASKAYCAAYEKDRAMAERLHAAELQKDAALWRKEQHAKYTQSQ